MKAWIYFILILLAACTSNIQPEGPQAIEGPGESMPVPARAPPTLECSSYTYSDCPDTCVSQCVPSGCTTRGDGTKVCTSDCEGPGSCVNK